MVVIPPRRPTTRRSVLPMQQTSPLSPTAERWKKQNDEAQRQIIKERALKELLDGRAITNGNAIKGDIQRIIKKYKEGGYEYITKGVIDYMLSKVKKSVNYTVSIPPVVDVTINNRNDSNDNSEVSPLTTDDTGSNNPHRNGGGRPKGSRQSDNKRISDTMKQALTEAATLCSIEKRRAEVCNSTVAPGKYKEIIELVEDESNLPHGSLKIGTIRCRILRNNLSGYKPQSTSPLHEIEPLLVQYCLKLARIKQPLTKDRVISLAESLIKNTKYVDRMHDFNKNNHAYDPNSDTIVGRRWYYGFLERNKEAICRQRGRVVDLKRHTWCTYEHFRDMYENNYERMVEAGVARKLEKEIFMDKEGNEVSSREEAYGLATKYVVTHPNL